MLQFIASYTEFTPWLYNNHHVRFYAVYRMQPVHHLGSNSRVWEPISPQRQHPPVNLKQMDIRQFRCIWERFVILVNRVGFPNLIAFLMLAQTLGMTAHGKRSVGQPRCRLRRRRSRRRPRNRGARSVLKSSVAFSSSDMERVSLSSNGNPSPSSSIGKKCVTVKFVRDLSTLG